MPLYEYQCDECAHRFEAIQKFSDPPLETCPKCGGAIRKLQSAPAFQFKGSGWYITDYAKKEQPAAAKAESGSTETTTPGKDAAAQSDKSSKPAASESPSPAPSSTTASKSP